MAGALDGIRVLDLTRFFAGPYGTTIFADLGAEVIKIEEPTIGDPQRHIPPLVNSQAYTFCMMNRNKKSLTLNLKSEVGKRLFQELVTRADVVWENFSPGVMERLGLGYEALKAINPALILASVSGFGQTGPYRQFVAYDIVAQATGGMMALTGMPDDPPLRTGPAIADLVGALYAAIGVLVALEHRRKTGQGQWVDISLQDGMWSFSAFEFAPAYYLTGQVRPRQGNRHPNVIPYNCYRAQDGYVVLATTTDQQWQALLRVMGREDLRHEARFSTLVERQRHVAEVDALVQAWMETRKSAEVLAKLRKAHLACAPVLTLDQVCQDPQLMARGMIQEMVQPGIGPIKLPGVVCHLSQTPGEITKAAPLLGQHNAEVYGGLLGHSEEEVERWRGAGVI